MKVGFVTCEREYYFHAGMRKYMTVAVILCAMTKQDESKVNCQDVSQSAQGGDKSH